MPKAIKFRIRRFVENEPKRIKGTNIYEATWRGQKFMNGKWKDKI